MKSQHQYGLVGSAYYSKTCSDTHSPQGEAVTFSLQSGKYLKTSLVGTLICSFYAHLTLRKTIIRVHVYLSSLTSDGKVTFVM